MLPPLFLSSICRYTAFPSFVVLANSAGTPSSSGTWYGANIAAYVPIVIPWQYPLKRFWMWNGSAVAGNIDIGLYSREGAKIVSTGSVAQAGTDQPQYISTPYMISPGSYYLAVSSNSGSSRVYVVSAASGASARLAGLLTQTAAFPLPNTMTPAASTDTAYPLFGMTLTESGF